MHYSHRTSRFIFHPPRLSCAARGPRPTDAVFFSLFLSGAIFGTQTAAPSQSGVAANHFARFPLQFGLFPWHTYHVQKALSANLRIQAAKHEREQSALTSEWRHDGYKSYFISGDTQVHGSEVQLSPSR